MNIDDNDNHFIDTHDDWATAPPRLVGPLLDATEETLFKAYARELCAHQIGIHKARQTRMNTDIQRYFNSTPARNAFARFMCLATYDNALYKKSNIAEVLCISRQAAHTMVEECLNAGWIERVKDEGYRATEELVWGMEDYVHRHLDMLEETCVHEAIAALLAYRKLRKAN